MEGSAEAPEERVPECSARGWQNYLHAHQHATLPPQDKLFQENENPCSVRFLRMHGNGYSLKRHKIERPKPAVLWVIPANNGAVSGRLTFGVIATEHD